MQSAQGCVSGSFGQPQCPAISGNAEVFGLLLIPILATWKELLGEDINIWGAGWMMAVIKKAPGSGDKDLSGHRAGQWIENLPTPTSCPKA